MTETAADRTGRNRQIRDWARRQGFELGERGRIPADVRAAWANSHAATVTGTVLEERSEDEFLEDLTTTFAVPEPAPQAGEPPPGDTAPGTGPDTAQDTPAAEQRPVPPPRGPRGLGALLGLGDEDRRAASKTGQKPETPRRARPPRAKTRVSLSNLAGLAWGGLARLAVAAGGTEQKYAPVAKIMSFQAPVVGDVVEDAAKGTVADRLLQPVARLIESGSELGAVLGPPALTMLVCARPDTYPVARPLLASCMQQWVIVAGPRLRAQRRKAEQFAAEMSQFGDEFGISIDDMLDEVFATMTGPPPPGPIPEPEMAGAHAAGG